MIKVHNILITLEEPPKYITYPPVTTDLLSVFGFTCSEHLMHN